MGLGLERSSIRFLPLLIWFPWYAHSKAAEGARQIRSILRHPAEFYGSETAREMAEILVYGQHQCGGWDKYIDPTPPFDLAKRAKVLFNRILGEKADGDTIKYSHHAAGFDNGATTTEIRFLSRVYSRTGAIEYRRAAFRGIGYTLSAQYPNGGWPQCWPSRAGYGGHITYNDHSMIRVLEMIRAISQGEAPFEWVDASTQKAARRSLDLGLDCIRRTQIRFKGELLGWAQQYDSQELVPVSARPFEIPAIASAETVKVLDFLLSQPKPDSATLYAIASGSRWLRAVAIAGYGIDTIRDDGGFDLRFRRVKGTSKIWARLYTLDGDKPVFGDHEGKARSDWQSLDRVLRTSYRWYGEWPVSILNKERLRRVESLFPVSEPIGEAGEEERD